MGGQPSKLRRLARKLVQRQKAKDLDLAEGELFNDDDRTLLLPGLFELENPGAANAERLAEIRQMKKDVQTRVQQLHATLDQFEYHHNRELDECANRSERNKIKTRLVGGVKGEPELEECRLRNALLVEKLRSCQEQFNTYDEILRKSETGDTFLRELLIKTARRQFKKSRLNEALETFYQLIIATNGQLCADEAWLLFEITSQKVSCIYSFYHRVADSVGQLGPETPNFVHDLFTSMVEDLRSECSEMYDVVLGIRVDAGDPAPMDEPAFVVEKLKYLTASRVCALWLQITPLEHDEFDDVKDLFYNSLGKDMALFTNVDVLIHDHDHVKVAEVFRTVLEDLCTKYPIAANTKRVQKMAAKVLGKKPNSAFKWKFH
ncbi:hypothetical protein M3Y99_01767100 [Aphelenchoides fujianensis]|nr:hypothetical protein M3Y99_01767100 [Aphelenchoides fujianensis]